MAKAASRVLQFPLLAKRLSGRQPESRCSFGSIVPLDDAAMLVEATQPALAAIDLAIAGLPSGVLYLDITVEVRMHTTNLRKVGGSVMLAVPPALLDLLKLKAGARVDIGIEEGRLIVAPRTRPSYTLDELLAQCDETAEADDEDRAWLDARPVGNELL